jgi:intraflagellar transport protein 88
MIQQGDIASAEKYAEVARDSDPYNAAAFVCLGNCSLRRADYNKAREFFLFALDNDAACVEALYNLGKEKMTHSIQSGPFSSRMGMTI